MNGHTIKRNLLFRLPKIENVIDLKTVTMEFISLSSFLNMKNGGHECDYNLYVEMFVEKQIGHNKKIEIKSIKIEKIVSFKQLDSKTKFVVTKEDLKEFINF